LAANPQQRGIWVRDVSDFRIDACSTQPVIEGCLLLGLLVGQRLSRAS
jgi:hypothetical protein